MIDMKAIGNVTRDAELKTTKSGKTICNFCLAVKTKKKDESGELITKFVDATLWGKYGETMCRYITKGRKMYIGGIPEVRPYMGKDGTPKASLQITVLDIEFLSGSMNESKEPADYSDYGKSENPHAAEDERSGFVPVDVGEDELPF